MSSGIITRKDIIEEDAITWGADYAKNVNIAIDSNKSLIESTKELSKISASYLKSTNQQEFITLKQQETLEFNKSVNAIKLEEQALKAAEKAKQETLKTRKLELDAIGKEETARKRTTKLSIEERVELEANNRVLKQAAREKLGLVSAYDKLNNKRTEAKKKLRDLIATEDASTKSIQKAQIEFDRLDAKVKLADDAVRDFTKNVGNYPKLNAFAGGLKNLVGAFGLVGGVTAFASVIKGAIGIVREYDAEIVNLAAVAGKSRDQIKGLEDQIRTVAKSSINGAIEVAKLASELIKLGSTEEETIALLKPIDDLSVALRATAEDAASLVKGLLNAYGEGADQAARYTDVLAAAANRTSLDFNGLRDSLSYLAPVANSLGLNLEQTSSIIGVLADNNIRAESAGRLMATSFTRLATNGMTLNQALDQVNEKQAEGATQLQILALAGKLFGAESAKLALILADNRDKMASLNKEFDNSKGSLEELTNKQLQSLDARIKLVSSSWENFVLNIEDGQGAIGSFVSDWLLGFSQLLDGLTRLNTSWDELNAKAEAAGKAEGLKKFQESINNYKNAGTTEASALSITLKQAQLDLSTFQGQLDTASSKLKEYENQNFFAGVFGGGYDMEKKYSEEIERLSAAVAQRKSIIEAANKALNKKDGDEVENAKKLTELTAEEQKKRLAEEEKRRKEHLVKMKKLDDDSFALNKFRLENEIEVGTEIAQNENELIDDRINAYLNAQQVEVALAEETAAYKLRSISKYNDSVRDLTNEEIQTLINGGDIKKKLTDDEILILEEYQSNKEAINKEDLENRQKIIDSIVSIEHKKTQKVLENQDTELNKKLLRENQDFEDSLEALKGNQKAIEDATIDHEERILKLKQDASKEALQTQIDDQKKLLENSELSADVRAALLNRISKLELDLNQISIDSKIETNEKKLLSEEEYNAKIEEAAIQLKDSLINLTNAILDAKISRIDDEIQANDEYYNNQLELAGNDAAQKEAIQAEAEKKRKALEKEKRKEQTKQAIFNKAITALEIGVNTGLAIVKAVAASPLTGGLPFSAIAAAIGAAQLAAVLATPIPKYEKGTKGKPHKGGPALVGEVRPEVIIEPGMNPYIINKPSILNLKKGTEVVSSVDEYKKLQRASIMATLDIEQNKISAYESFEKNYDMKQLEQKIQSGIENGFKKAKTNIHIKNPDIDIGHEIWKLGNTRWP